MLKLGFRLIVIKRIEVVWSRAKYELKKATSRNFGMVSTWEKNKRSINAWMQEITTAMGRRVLTTWNEWKRKNGEYK